ncbi:MAG: hypothetical protein ACOCQX_01530 [Candidatus Nanoarchaeia archaeon]
MLYKVFNNQEYRLGLFQENVEMVVYTLVSFFVSFFIGHPQFIVGTIVNCALILGALNVRSYKLLPIIIAPSLGVFARGLLFGPFTIFLLYMIPFIWVGNLIILYVFKLNKNKFIALPVGALAKAGFLFIAAYALFSFGLVPKVFLFAMGAVQLATAFSGGLVAIGIQKVKNQPIKSLFT